MSKKNLALLLFIAFGISLGCAIKYYPQQQRLPSSALDAPRRPARAVQGEAQPAAVQSSVQKNETQRYAGYQTDLFRPLFDNPPPPEQKAESQTLQAPPVPLTAPPADPAPALEPPFPGKLAGITYLGQVSDGAKSSVFLKEKDRIFVVEAGEAFGKKKEFLLAEVTEKEIRIAMTDREDLIRIPLQKKKALKSVNAALPLAKTAKEYFPRPLPNPPGNERL